MLQTNNNSGRAFKSKVHMCANMNLYQYCIVGFFMVFKFCKWQFFTVLISRMIFLNSSHEL